MTQTDSQAQPSLQPDFSKLAQPGIQRIEPYIPGKPAQEVAKEYGIKTIIKLASNENPLGSSPKALEALPNALQHLGQYPDGKCAVLKEAISAFTGFAEEWITVGNGSDEIINLIANTFVGESDEVIFSRYSFEVYSIVAKAVNARIKEIDTFAEDHASRPMGQDLDAMLEAITEQTKLICIANPNNPTGELIDNTRLHDFLSKVPTTTLVLLDEAYVEYVDVDAYQTGLDIIRDYPNVIVTRTFSKIYGLPGLRVGFGIAHPDMTALMNRIRAPFNVNTMAQVAGAAALSDTAFVERSFNENKHGREWLRTAIHQRGMTILPSQANFICFKTRHPGKKVFQALLKYGIIVRNLASYDMPYYIRVTVGTMAQNEAFMDAFDQVMALLDKENNPESNQETA